MSLEADVLHGFAIQESPEILDRDEPPSSRFVDVPNEALGRVLDGGKAAAHAVKLLAIKADKGPTFALYEDYCHRKYGVSRRSFQKGMRHAVKRHAWERTKLGKVTRTRTGKIYRRPTEGPLAGLRNGKADRYVSLNPKLLHEAKPYLIAFVAAVKLSRDPIRPNVAAARIGIKSGATIRALTAKAVKDGHVVKGFNDQGAVLLGRQISSFDHIKSGAIKNEPIKSGATDSKMEEPHRTMEERPPSTENNQSHGTRFRAGDALKDFEDEEVQDLSRDPDWITLKDWRKSGWFAGVDLNTTDQAPKVAMSLEQWRVWLCHFTDYDVPGHLTTPAAHRQALEIAHELSSPLWSGHDITAGDVMEALVVRLAKAIDEQRVIFTLAYVAEPIARNLCDGDNSLIFNRQSYLSEGDHAAAHDLAIKIAEALESFGYPIFKDRLLSTGGLERLASMIKKRGRSAIVDAVNRCTGNKKKPSEGEGVFDWSWFDDEIEAAANKPKRRKRKAA